MLSNGDINCEYDSANRLISAGGHMYTYNAEDVRIRNLCSDADTTYTYNTNCRLSQLLQKTTNSITTKYVYGLGLIGEDKCGEFKTYHFDFRGSTVAITDECGNITDTFKYDTYGKMTEHIGNSFVIFGYNGRDGVVTDRNGLLYMRARYYSPEMRRFINADIISGEISNAITLNRYAYANGNPVSNVDPFGLSANFWKAMAGVAIIGGLAAATILTGGTAGVILGGALAGAIAGGTIGAVTGYIDDGMTGAANGFLTGTIAGGVSGALAASSAGAVLQGIGSAAINIGESALESLLANDFSNLSIQSLVVDAATGMIMGYIDGDGLLRKNNMLSSAVSLYDDTMMREMRRSNQAYASKEMAKIKVYYTDVRADALSDFFNDALIDDIKGAAFEFSSHAVLDTTKSYFVRNK